MNIFVGNLSFGATGGDLKKLFEGFGKVASAVIVTRKEKKTPKPRGFGFVEMPDESQARGAIAALNGKEFMGRVLKVNPARLRKEFPRGSEPGKKTWPKVLLEAKRHPREEREQRKSWINPAFNKSGTHRGPRSAGSYMKRDGLTEMREETKPWRRREDQPRPWQKSPSEREPWKIAKDEDKRPWRKTEGAPEPWSKRENRPRSWQKSSSEHKPWKRVEEGARRPWKKAEGESKPWSKPGRSGFKPWERTEGQSRPWKRPKGGFESGKKAQGEAKPWSKRRDQPRPWQKSPSEHKPWKKAEEGAGRPWKKAPEETKPWIKSSERPRRSGFNPSTSSFDKLRSNPERVKRVEGSLGMVRGNGERSRTKGRKNPG